MKTIICSTQQEIRKAKENCAKVIVIENWKDGHLILKDLEEVSLSIIDQNITGSILIDCCCLGSLDLSNTICQRSLMFQQTTVIGKTDLRGMAINGGIEMQKSYFIDQMIIDEMVVHEKLEIIDSRVSFKIPVIEHTNT